MAAKITDLETAAALWRVGEIHSHQLPGVACDLLEVGLDSSDLRMLAGLVEANIEQAPGLFQNVLDSAGYGVMPLVQAVRIYIRLIAKKIVSGEIEPYRSARMIFAVTVRVNVNNFHGADPFIYAADEYEDRPDDRKFFEAAILSEAQQWLDGKE